jgi:mycofactocin glycosyltransferase
VRPAVSVVMPFAGTDAQARAALAGLAALALRPGDELILADNQGIELDVPEPVRVVPAQGERSPAHARNAGAAVARGDWVLFIDADCRAPADLLDRYFDDGPPEESVGALAGDVVPAAAPVTLAERYGAARNFLSPATHFAHPYLPRAAAANLLVRRGAFHAVGGFREGLRAAEDTDLCWRLQRAGWRLELRSAAAVEHRYRSTVHELRRQWRGYAAGRAWLARQYPDFRPEPALRRAVKRLAGGRRGGPGRSVPEARTAGPAPTPRGIDRIRFLALDLLLAVDELVGFTMPNEPRR